MPANTIFDDHKDADADTFALKIQKWGGLASFLLAATYIIPGVVYLVGNLREALGPLAYSLADFLYGPVWAASLVTAVYALRERIGGLASRRMTLALLAVWSSAAVMVAVAFIRSSNRQYHLMHPELHLEMSTPVLVVWTTLVAGLIATGWHLLGWGLLLTGWSGWTSRRLPRILSGLFLLGGIAALFVYVQPELEGFVILLGVVMSIWQGILLWKGGRGEAQAPEIISSRS